MWPISDDQLREVLRDLPAVVYQDSHEPHPRTIYLSPNADTILGNGPDEHLRDPDLWWRSIDPRDHDGLMSTWARAFENEEPYTVDYRYRRPDGRVIWLREHATPVRGDDGEVGHWQGVLLDFTAERTAADALAASEARNRSLVEHLPASVYTISADDPKRILYASDVIEELYGYPAERWVEEPDLWADVIHPDDRDEVVAGWSEAHRVGTTFERRYRLRRADGEYRWIVDRIRPIRRDGEIVEWEGMSFDVTLEHETASALRESDRRHERLLQQIPGIAFSLLTRPKREFDYLSPRVQDILGYPRSLWFEEDGFWTEVIHEEDRERVLTEWSRCVDEGSPFRIEYRVRHADGHTVWLRADTLPIRGADGEIERWQGLWLDITETQVARHERARLEASYQQMVEQAPAIVFTTDARGAVRYMGPQVEQILGYSVEAWKTDPFMWEALLHPDDRARVLETWGEARRSGRPFDAEYRLLLANGTFRWVHETTHPVRDVEGTLTSWHGLTVDVHELHTATEAREAAEARARALLENVPAVVYEMGPDDERRTLYVSPHIERLLGYSRQEWLDQPDIWAELLHPDDREIELDAHDQHSSTGEPWSREYRMIAADGQVVWVRDQAILAIDSDGCPSWQGVLVDVTSQHVTAELLQITNEELERRVQERTTALEDANELMGMEIAERRRAEKEAFAARERYRVLVEHMPAITYIWRTASHASERPDDDADYYVSPRIEEILGYTPREWHDEACWINRLHPHDRDEVVAAMLHAEETGEPFAKEFRYLAKDGSVVWIEDHATLLSRKEDGRPALFHGVMLDVTARKEAESQAAEAEERYRQITEEGPFVTYTVTIERADPPTFTVDYMSPQLLTLVGYDASTLGTDPERWFETIHPDDRDGVRAELTRHWVAGTTFAIEYRVIAADGRVMWLRDRGRCVERDDLALPRRFLGLVVDVTDEMEEQQRQRDELARLQTIVAGIPAISWMETVDDAGGDPHYLYISPQVEQVLGYRAEELLTEREHFPRMIHPEDEDRVDASWRRACWSGAATWQDRWRARHRDGTYRWIQAHARRVSDPGTTPILWVGISVDTTDEMARGSPRTDAETDRV